MSGDETEIRAVVAAYVTGFNRGDRALLMSVFHENFISAGFVKGAPQWDSGEEFATFCEEAAPDRDGPIPDWQIERLTVSGRTAVAIVQDGWGARRFRDSLTLLKTEAGWKIAFKAFDGLS